MTWQHTAASCRFSEPIRVPVNHPRYGQNKIHTPWTERLIGASSNYCTFWWPLITSNFVQALASCRNWLVIKHTSLFMKILPMIVASAGVEGRTGFKLHTSLQLWWSGARLVLTFHCTDSRTVQHVVILRCNRWAAQTNMSALLAWLLAQCVTINMCLNSSTLAYFLTTVRSESRFALGVWVAISGRRTVGSWTSLPTPFISAQRLHELRYAESVCE
jgi:hypothetical protein